MTTILILIFLSGDSPSRTDLRQSASISQAEYSNMTKCLIAGKSAQAADPNHIHFYCNEK
jgi:hypothetical protein